MIDLYIPVAYLRDGTVALADYYDPHMPNPPHIRHTITRLDMYYGKEINRSIEDTCLYTMEGVQIVLNRLRTFAKCNPDHHNVEETIKFDVLPADKTLNPIAVVNYHSKLPF